MARPLSIALLGLSLLFSCLVTLPSQVHAADFGTPAGGGDLGTPAGGGGDLGTPGGSTDLGTPADGSNGGLKNPLNHIDSFDQLLSAILDAVIYLGGIVLVLMLVYVGFLFVVAQGKEEKISEARNALLWTVIGGLILLGAKAIMLVIQGTVAGL